MKNAKKNTSDNIHINNTEYTRFFNDLKNDIQQTQLRSALSITKELIFLYWRTGKVISKKVQEKGWGAKTLQRLSRDLKIEFPDVKGFSIRNLQYMRKFYNCYPDQNYAATAAQIP